MNIKYKYKEDIILEEIKKFVDSTYSQHYKTDSTIQCFDAWIALDESMPTFRNTAIKYLWRYGKKHGNNKEDLIKAIHYIILCFYVDHHKTKTEQNKTKKIVKKTRKQHGNKN